MEEDIMKWISVKDRLPEEGKEVIVKILGQELIQTLIRYTEETEVFSDDEEWVEVTYIFKEKGCGCCKDKYYYTIDEVTHWMALPEEPKDSD